MFDVLNSQHLAYWTFCGAACWINSYFAVPNIMHSKISVPKNFIALGWVLCYVIPCLVKATVLLCCTWTRVRKQCSCVDGPELFSVQSCLLHCDNNSQCSNCIWRVFLNVGRDEYHLSKTYLGSCCCYALLGPNFLCVKKKSKLYFFCRCMKLISRCECCMHVCIPWHANMKLFLIKNGLILTLPYCLTMHCYCKYKTLLKHQLIDVFYGLCNCQCSELHISLSP